MESHSDPLRKIPTKHAPEAKADIGSVLKAARTKKGASLEAVGQHTRISKRFLEALENNRFEEFPALAYLRGFLKGYCDYLEVDFDALWKQVVEAPAPAAPAAAPATSASPTTPTPKAGPAAPAHAPKPATPPPAAAPAPKEPTHYKHGASSAKPAPVPVPQAPASHAPAAHAASSDTPAASGAIAGILIALGAAAVLAGIFFVTPKKTPQAPAAVEPQPAAQMPAALQPLKPAMEPQLTLIFRRDMWVSVSVDGVEKFQGRVPQGAKQEWKGKRALSLRASDPQALKLTLNGAPFTLPAPDAGGSFRIEAP